MWFFGLLLAVAGLSSFRTADIAVSRPDRAQRRSLAKLERSYEYIRKMYVDSVDMAPLVEEAIRSMYSNSIPIPNMPRLRRWLNSGASIGVSSEE